MILNCDNPSCASHAELSEVTDFDLETFLEPATEPMVAVLGPPIRAIDDKRYDISELTGWTFNTDDGWLCPRCTKET